jgi:hypothetical protein
MFIVRFSPVDVNADLAVVPYFGLDIGRFFAGADCTSARIGRDEHAALQP